ncbi:hypothetical protein [Lacticaseibacillus rhamnosus]|uniref:hypothetical protein n=1 Tax=Lacticaseibacillus rhamnosus TaxID=47715 RepID=UPI00280AC7FD|nr:hypothetical protein [Lacticaseibacillus rhamnosus]
MKTIDEMNEFDRDIILLHRKSVCEDTPPEILQKVKAVRDDISNDLTGITDPIEKEFTLECYDETIRKLRDLSVEDYQKWLSQNENLEGFEL